MRTKDVSFNKLTLCLVHFHHALLPQQQSVVSYIYFPTGESSALNEQTGRDSRSKKHAPNWLHSTSFYLDAFHVIFMLTTPSSFAGQFALTARLGVPDSICPCL